MVLCESQTLRRLKKSAFNWQKRSERTLLCRVLSCRAEGNLLALVMVIRQSARSDMVKKVDNSVSVGVVFLSLLNFA